MLKDMEEFQANTEGTQLSEQCLLLKNQIFGTCWSRQSGVTEERPVPAAQKTSISFETGFGQYRTASENVASSLARSQVWTVRHQV